MKKLTFWSILSLMIALLPLVVACGGDDETSGGGERDGDLISKAIGTWMCTQSTDVGQGQTYQGMMVGKEVTINANGTYTSTAQSIGYTGTYVVNGNKITARSNNGSTFVITVSIIGDRMTWDGTASNGVTFKYIFVREDNAAQQTTIPITSEMIAGTAWTVKSFTIERGSNSNIQNDKTIVFKTDGSCEGFHSMETAWRINSGRIETYYEKTNEPMYVYSLLSQNGDEVQIKMNGTLDDELQATLTLTKTLYEETPSSTTEESYNKEQVLSIRNACYAHCAEFEEAQLKLEEIRTNSSTVHNITSSTWDVNVAWTEGYTTIQCANIILDHKDSFSSLFSTQELNSLLAEIRFLRAFVYYNITTLWGDAPFITTASVDGQSSYARYNKNTILDFALGEVNLILPDLTLQDDKLRISRDAGLMLKAELEMALGKTNSAITTLNEINTSPYVGTRATSTSLRPVFIWALAKSTQTNLYYPVYTLMHHQLYLYETTGNKDNLMLPVIDTNLDGVPDDAPIEAYWLKSEYLDYGYWTALKRMGKAQAVTGCYDYELLMPIPKNEIGLSQNMTQNPGY